MSLRFAEKRFDKKINYNSYVSFLNAGGQTVPLQLFEKPGGSKDSIENNNKKKEI